MKVSDIKQQVGDLVGFDHSYTTLAARFLRWINEVRRELSKVNDWKFLRKQHYLQIPADVTAGTVSVSQDSQTVTGDSTAFASSMIGSYISFGTNGTGEYEYYRVIAVNSTTELIINSPYIGSSLTTTNYVIRRIFHRVPGDVRKLEGMYEFTVPSVIKSIGEIPFISWYPDHQRITSTPGSYQVFGISGREDTYTTGTVSGSIDSRTLTGSGTSWLANIIPGDKIVINGDTNTYHVKSIETDTSLTLYQKLNAAVVALTTYTATSNPDSWMVRFAHASDSRALIPIEYYHHVYDFVQDDDEDEFTRIYPELIVEGVVVWEKRASDDQSWTTDFQKWQSSVRKTIGSLRESRSWKPNISRYLPNNES